MVFWIIFNLHFFRKTSSSLDFEIKYSAVIIISKSYVAKTKLSLKKGIVDGAEILWKFKIRSYWQWNIRLDAVQLKIPDIVPGVGDTLEYHRCDVSPYDTYGANAVNRH